MGLKLSCWGLHGFLMSDPKDPRDPQPIFTDVKAQCHVGSFLTSENLLHNRKNRLPLLLQLDRPISSTLLHLTWNIHGTCGLQVLPRFPMFSFCCRGFSDFLYNTSSGVDVLDSVPGLAPYRLNPQVEGSKPVRRLGGVAVRHSPPGNCSKKLEYR